MVTKWTGAQADAAKPNSEKRLDIPWTSAADGSYTQTVQLSGTIRKVVTNPGSQAPTDNYDITLVDVDGIDIAEGLLMNRDTANSEEVYLYKEVTLTGAVPAPIPVAHTGAVVVTIANAGDSKQGNVSIYYR